MAAKKKKTDPVDATAAERQKRYREKRKAEKGVEFRHWVTPAEHKELTALLKQLRDK